MGSGWAGGRCSGGGAEWIDRFLADEEAQNLANSVSFQMQPIQGAAEFAVLLLNEGLLAAGLLPHQVADVAAEVMDDLEHVAPEGGGAEAGDDGEIAADLDEGAAERAAAHLKIEILR